MSEKKIYKHIVWFCCSHWLRMMSIAVSFHLSNGIDNIWGGQEGGFVNISIWNGQSFSNSLRKYKYFRSLHMVLHHFPGGRIIIWFWTINRKPHSSSIPNTPKMIIYQLSNSISMYGKKTHLNWNVLYLQNLVRHHWLTNNTPEKQTTLNKPIKSIELSTFDEWHKPKNVGIKLNYMKPNGNDQANASSHHNRFWQMVCNHFYWVTTNAFRFPHLHTPNQSILCFSFFLPNWLNW